MKRKRRASRLPAVLAMLVLAGVGGAAAWAWRFHPEWLKGLMRSAPPVAPSAFRPRGSTALHGELPHPKTVPAAVYYLRVTGGEVHLVAASRAVPAAAPARMAIEELLSGPVPEGCLRPLPNGVKLRGITLKEGVATADFSRELVANFHGGAGSEEAAVYAIVNTLGSVPGVRKVHILVEGKACGTLGGHLDIRGPMSPRRAGE